MAKTKRMADDFLNTTARLYLIHHPEQNAQVHKACTQQRTVHNRTVQHLLGHRSDEPLQRSKSKGVSGLFGHWSETWRHENTDFAETPCIVARGAITWARLQVERWEATNHEHAVLITKALSKGEPIPRRVQRRIPNPKQLFRSRKREEQLGRHRCRIEEKVRRVDRRTLHVPGIGKLTTSTDVPEDLDIRSCVILERTPTPRLQHKLKPEDRTFKIHISGRLPKPHLKDEPGRACGIDHGIVNTMTVASDDDTVEVLRHEAPLRPQRSPHSQP